MPHSWTLADTIDLDYFMAQDQGGDPRKLHRRDRQLLADRGAFEELGDTALLSIWLAARRKTPAHGHSPPGSVITAALSATFRLGAIIATVAGVAAGFAFFSYSGTTPVNVFYFLALCILPQIIFMIGAALLLMKRMAAGGKPSGQPSTGYHYLFNHVLKRVMGRTGTPLAGERQATYEAVLGLIRARGTRFSTLLGWRLAAQSQLILAIANGGILIAGFISIATRDIAFGWQSTMDFSIGSIYRFVQLISLPWSWLFPEPIGHPSLAEIEGSRIILKEGIGHLATENLVSWWPFLLLSLLVYGILVRLLIYGAAQYRYLRLNRPDTALPGCRLLLRRLRGPLVSSQATTPEQTRGDPQPAITQEASISLDPSSPQPVTMFIAMDIEQEYGRSLLDTIARRHGFAPIHTTTITDGPDHFGAGAGQTFDAAVSSRAGLLLAEAWMAPIGDTLDLIKAVRAVLEDEIPLYVGLLGRMDYETGYPAPVTADDWAVWRKRISALGDPFVAPVVLGSAENSR
jgi:hypothetical protein